MRKVRERIGVLPLFGAQPPYAYYSKIIFRFPTIADAKATLSSTQVTWTGSYRKPAVTLKLDGNKLEKNVDYTVTYKNNKNVGKATAVIKGTGWFQGSLTKTFIIKPTGTTVTKAVSPAKGAVRVTWAKQGYKMSASRIDGYQIQVATDSSFTKNTVLKNRKGYANTAKNFTGLKSGKTYYVRVRTVKTVSGVRYTSAWSKAKTVKVK